MGNSIRVVLADDHPIARDGIKFLLSHSDSISLVGEASDGKEALNLVEKEKPDVLICDISMPEVNGVELAQSISDKFPYTKVLVLSMHSDQEYILKSYEAGAMGYLPKHSDEKELIEAVEVIASGQKHITPSVSQILAQGMLTQRNSAQTYNLTAREKEILGLLVEGLSNKQIAADLFVSIRTVDTHRTNIMKKLNVKNTADLVRVSMKEKLC